MARIRTIKPEFWCDEKIAPLAPIDRLVFLGLISLADDAGRLIDNPKMLDAMIFPLTDDTCRKSLDALGRISRVIRYQDGSGQSYIQVRNWRKHQKVDHPSKFVFPAPTAEDLTRASRERREDSAKVSRHDPRSPTPDQVPPTKDHNDPVRSDKPKRTSGRAQYTSSFEQFWAAFPRRVGKGRAADAWKRLKCHEILEKILEHVEAMKKSEDWTRDGGQFIPHPTTWLNGRRWDDPVPDNGSPIVPETVVDLEAARARVEARRPK